MVLSLVLVWPWVAGAQGNLGLDAAQGLVPLHFAFEASPDDSAGGTVAEYLVFRAKKPDGFTLADSLAIVRIPATGAAEYRFEIDMGFGKPFWYTVVAADGSGHQSDPCDPLRAVVQE
jgi:hypothetical protein